MTATRCDDVRHGSTRFCPRCGAWRDAGRRRQPSQPDRRRILALIGSCCLAVVVAVVAVVAVVGAQGMTGELATDTGPVTRAQSTPADVPTATRSDEVDLPARTGVTGDASGAGDTVADEPFARTFDGRGRRHVRDVGAEAAGVAACRPRGCVRWERRIDGLLTASGGAVHVVTDRQVRTYDATSGTLQWRRSLIDPLPSGAAPDGFAIHPPPVAIDAHDGMIVTASDHRIVALDQDGSWRWTTVSAADDTVELVRLVADGHVVSTTRTDDDALPPMRVAGLDAADGAERWARPVTAVLAIDEEVVTVIDEGGAIAGIGTTDGLVRWQRAATSDPTNWPSLLAGRDTAAAAPADDGRQGGTVSGFTLERRDEPPADRRLARGAARARFQTIVVGFPGGSATISGTQPRVLLADPSVVVVDERLLGMGHDG